VIRAAPGAPARELSAATLARVVLAVLVVASVAGLFYAQALKHQAPLLRPVKSGTDTFQPGGTAGQGLLREAHFRVRASVDDVLDISVITPAGHPVAVVRTALAVHKYRETPPLHWDGRTTGGALAAPGTYLVRVRFQRAGQTVTVPNLQLLLKGSSG
jgi:hypothetical protein